MKKSILITLQIVFSSVFLFLFIAKLLSLEVFTVDVLTILLFVLVMTPWFLPWIIKHGFKIKTPFGYEWIIEGETIPAKHVKVVETEEDVEKEIKFDEVLPVDVLIKENYKYLSFRARINYEKEAGAGSLLKIRINDTFLNPTHAMNKKKQRYTIDKRVHEAFEPASESWKVVYSPDFVTNYSHEEKYKEVFSDAYLFIFNVAQFLVGKNELTVDFIHRGLGGHEAYKNSIIIRDVILF